MTDSVKYESNRMDKAGKSFKIWYQIAFAFNKMRVVRPTSVRDQ